MGRLSGETWPRVFGFGLLCACPAGIPIVAAAEMDLGNLDVQIDTTVTLGAALRMSGQDCALVSVENGGCTAGPGLGFGVNSDDGNVNHERWDMTSTAAKITVDVETLYRNYGVFFRTTSFYDYWAAQEVGEDPTRFGVRPLEDRLRGDDARHAAARSFDVLDAFVFGNFDVADRPVTLRLGRQVVNWGESLFIQGGINSYLPVDVTALRTPGSEIREALRPEPSVYASILLPADLSVEAFYTFGWERTELDACGTFFANSDAFCEGGAYLVSGGEFPNAPVIIPRIESQEARSQGQFGLAARHYAGWLNKGTDLAAYFVNSHSKLPIATFTAAAGTIDLNTISPAFPAGTVATNTQEICGAFLGLGGIPNTFANCSSSAAGTALGLPGGTSVLDLALGATANTKSTLAQYPEDIRTVGASFNTSVHLFGGTAFAGELAFTPDMPFQLADTEINANDLETFGTDDFAAGLPPGTLPDNSLVRPGAAVVPPGAVIPGFEEFDVITGQLQTTSSLSQSEPMVDFIGADQLLLLGNAGFQNIVGLNDGNNRFAAPRSGDGHPNALVDAVLGEGVGFQDFASAFSWGYRLVAMADYNNAFGSSWLIQPSVQFGHDVGGISAGPIGPGFVEGRKALTLRLAGSLRDTWRLSTEYTNSFGAKLDNVSYDKDFASITVSRAF